MPSNVTRRQFVQTSAATAAGVLIGRSAPAAEKSAKKVRYAMVGVGGRGKFHCTTEGTYPLGWAGSEGIVALCDVNAGAVARAAGCYPNAKKYKDYRKMFEHADDFDAVVVATPDHSHFPVAMRALKAGKHVYCEKPLTWSVWEAQQLTIEAAKQKVATQMGNQYNGAEGWRILYEYVHGGAIGDVKEIHTWSPCPMTPQGFPRPKGEDPIPDWLYWDGWIGPAPMRPFKHGVYCLGGTGDWLPFYDFGTGALQMATHTMNPLFQVMTPGYPTGIELLEHTGANEETFPKSQVIKWVFPKTEKRPGFEAYWYDGGRKPKRSEELEKEREMQDAGIMFVGTKGTILADGHYSISPRLLPETKNKEYGRPKKLLERSPGHYKEFVMAARGEKPWDYPKSNFQYSGPMTAVILMGIVAQRVGKQKLEFDPKTLKFTNSDKANGLLRRTARKGWDKYM